METGVDTFFFFFFVVGWRVIFYDVVFVDGNIAPLYSCFSLNRSVAGV